MYNQPEVKKLSLEIIEELNKHKIPCTVLTKGLLPQELSDPKKYGRDNTYGITLTSLDEEYQKTWEPGTAPIQDRIEALKLMSNRGEKTFVSIEPYPTPNIVDQEICNLLESIKFVDKIIFGKIHYTREATEYLKSDHDFYKRCIAQVIQFCMKKRIEYYIKEKTLPELNK